MPVEPDFAEEWLTVAARSDRSSRDQRLQPPVGSAHTMPNGIKPVDPLDSLSSVGAAYRSGGQPGTCKYWILDLGTCASYTCTPAAASRVAAGAMAAAPSEMLCVFTLKCVIC